MTEYDVNKNWSLFWVNQVLFVSFAFGYYYLGYKDYEDLGVNMSLVQFHLFTWSLMNIGSISYKAIYNFSARLEESFVSYKNSVSFLAISLFLVAGIMSFIVYVETSSGLLSLLTVFHVFVGAVIRYVTYETLIQNH